MRERERERERTKRGHCSPDTHTVCMALLSRMPSARSSTVSTRFRSSNVLIYSNTNIHYGHLKFPRECIEIITSCQRGSYIYTHHQYVIKIISHSLTVRVCATQKGTKIVKNVIVTLIGSTFH